MEIVAECNRMAAEYNRLGRLRSSLETDPVIIDLASQLQRARTALSISQELTKASTGRGSRALIRLKNGDTFCAPSQPKAIKASIKDLVQKCRDHVHATAAEQCAINDKLPILPSQAEKNRIHISTITRQALTMIDTHALFTSDVHSKSGRMPMQSIKPRDARRKEERRRIKEERRRNKK